MPTPSIWSGVAVAMQSALGANKTITAITKANPGVVSSTAHGFANGAYVVLNVLGMGQVDDRVFRVANQAANTFELEGENTTLYDTFTSGVANEITFGTTISTLTTLSASGGDFNFIDITTIHDLVKSQIPGAANPIAYNFDAIWDASDAGMIAMKAASDLKALRAFRFTFSNSQKMVFEGYVGTTLLPAGSSQDLVKTPVSLTMFGRPTFYAT